MEMLSTNLSRLDWYNDNSADLHNHLTSLYFLHSDILTTFLHAYLEIGAILLDEADAEGFGLYHNATTIDFEIREILDRFELLILQKGYPAGNSPGNSVRIARSVNNQICAGECLYMQCLYIIEEFEYYLERAKVNLLELIGRLIDTKTGR
ncbi:hypothetical protein BSL78_08230 [Apostichopus japonicus]|uniref:Uncharacterized protein n=2 Tax=Stichopus japonicus TaxID=307972 RepID=A0A2G8L3Q0_STIJA|nr:hypothetical protein BSL78_08230 [Apostichopus japonicus]